MVATLATGLADQVQRGTTRVNFDIHRAFGLWTWVMLFVFAWSSVGFNLDEVYTPVMNTLFGAPPEPEHHAAVTPPARPPLVGKPKLDWHQARDRGHGLLAEKALKDGFAIKYKSENSVLLIDRDTGSYTLCDGILVKAEDNLGQACVIFDADTGAALSETPTKPPSKSEQEARLSDTFSGWLVELHMARVFGLAMKIFVCVMGLVITALSVTGVVIWWKKRRGAKAMQKKTTSAKNIPRLNN
ncbi:MAG: PepSY domain-containing protein [Methylococcaceae bacterium]|nr:PepSY domain-containing protein [Methylococcaceae bacterium]